MALDMNIKQMLEIRKERSIFLTLRFRLHGRLFPEKEARRYLVYVRVAPVWKVKSCNEQVDELACHAEPVEALSQLLGQVILTAAGPAVQTEEPHNHIRDRPGCILGCFSHRPAGMDVGV